MEALLVSSSIFASLTMDYITRCILSACYIKFNELLHLLNED